MRTHHIFFCLFAALALHYTGAEAVWAPKPNVSATAGVVERSIEQEFGPKPVWPDKPIPMFEIDLPEAQYCINDNEVVCIERIEFIGNEVISSTFLKEYLCNYCNAYLTMNDLNSLCRDIQELYVYNGYFLARAYLPEQEVIEGLLVVRILEGSIANIYVEGNCHYSSSFIRSYVHQFEGCPAHYDSLLRALLLLNEYDDLLVSCVFAKSEALGCTDIILNVRDWLPIHEYAAYNNFGVRNTPRNRFGARLDYGNFLFYGDTFSCVGVVGAPVNQLRFAQADYSIPINRNGLWIESSYLRTDFHTHAEHHLDIDGESQVTNVTLLQELTRTRTLSTDCFVSFDYKRVENFAFHKSQTLDKLRILGAGYWLEYTDCFWGRNWLEFDAYVGLPNFWGGSKSRDGKSSRLGAGGNFQIGNLYFTRVQKLPFDSFLLFNFAGQISSHLLPLSEQFYIGGWDSVRGYTTAYRLGDNGYYANLELRVAPPCVADWPVSCYWPDILWRDFIQFVGFIDNGGVKVKKDKKRRHDKNVINSAEKSGDTHYLTGAGFGVRLFGPCGLNVVVDVGFPIDHRKSPEVYVKLDWEFL